MSEQEITNDELARMIKDGFDAIGKDIDQLKSDVSVLKSDVSTLKSDVGTLKSDVSTLKSDVDTLKADVIYIKSQMVTKDYLDDKLADSYGDVVVLFRKEDRRFSELVSILSEKAVLSANDVKRIDTLRPLVATGQ